MNIRYQESTNTIAPDFAVRQRKPAPAQIIGLFVCVFVVTACISVIISEKILLLPLLLAIFGILCWYILTQIQFVQDQLLDAEFQNALFSSSLSLNHIFLAIVRKDSTITYFNKGFQETFPKFLRQPRRGIDMLLDQCEVKAPDRDKLLDAIANDRNDQIIFDIYSDIGPYTIIMSAEPISKPSGFVLLRGRKFVEVRKHTPSNPLIS